MRVLAIYPDYLDATSWYRGAGPLAHLCRNYPGIEVTVPNQLAWPQLADTDVVYLQRPHADDHLRALQQAKQMGKPVWVDYDDNPFCVPLSNPAWEGYAKPGVVETIRQILQNADALTVSTKALADAFQPLNPKVQVIPNALDTRHIPMPEKRPQTQKVVLWRGSHTHAEDLEMVANQYRALIQKHPDWRFVFMGYLPYKIAGNGRCRTFENVRFYTTKSVMGYFQSLIDLAPRVLVVPLVDDLFNRCKSNIAWIEGTVAGAVTYASALPEWKIPGATGLTSSGFESQIGFELGLDAADSDDAWKLSRDYIMENLTLDLTNRKRLEVLEALMK